MSAQVIPFPQRASCVNSQIGKLVVHRPVPTVASVLSYLDAVRAYAELVHDRDAANHYESVWKCVFEFTHGPLPRRQPSPEVTGPLYAVTQKAVPKWKLSVLARPMRKVVATHSSVKRGAGYFASLSFVVLTLECGHRVEELSCMVGDKTPHRRRCQECAA